MMDVSQFIDSQEMREYLKTVQLSERTCEELVCGAPRPLSEKLAWLEQWGSPALAEKAKGALDGLKLKPGEFLWLTSVWYDSDFHGWDSGSVGPFPSLDAAVRHICEEMADEEWDEDSLCWTQLDKWMPGEDGAYHQSYTYYLIRDEIVYFDNPTGRWDHFCGAPDLDIPIPFKPGEIVYIDCTPFMPPKPVVLLEVNNHDCCGVTCLFRGEDGSNWEVGSVKHSRCWSGLREHPAISPLYRLARYYGDLWGGSEGLLEKVSKYIDGDAKKGQRLWKDLDLYMARTDNCGLYGREILSFLE